MDINILCIGDSIIGGYHNVWGENRSNDEKDLLFCPLHIHLTDGFYSDIRKNSNTIEFSGFTIEDMEKEIKLLLDNVYNPTNIIYSGGVNNILLNGENGFDVFSKLKNIILYLSDKCENLIILIPSNKNLDTYICFGESEEETKNRINEVNKFRNLLIDSKYNVIDTNDFELDDCIHLSPKGIKDLSIIVKNKLI